MTANRFVHCCLCTLIVLVLFFGAPLPVRAAAFTLQVDTTLDSNAPADQACTDAPDDCSLRGAITRANGDAANAYTLELQDGATYALALVGAGETSNATGDLNIHVDLTIRGAGATLDAAGIDRAIQTMNTDLLIENLTIINGRAPRGADGTVSLRNGGMGGNGGGILAEGNGSLALTDCVLTNNRAGDGGNGFEGQAATEAVAAGTGGRGGQGGSGGAVYLGSGVSAMLLRVRIHTNSAGSGGAGAPGGAGSAQFAGGAGGNGGSSGHGGGVAANFGLALVESVIQANVSGSGGAGGAGGTGGANPSAGATAGGAGGSGGWAGSGGGLYVLGLTAERALVAGNTAGNGGNGGAGGTGGNSDAGIGGGGGRGGDGGLAGSGGGLNVDSAIRQSTFTNITVSHNVAGNGGAGGAGGAPGTGPGGTGLTGANGANQPKGNGGGLHNTGATNNTYLNFVTFTGNVGIGGGFENHGNLLAKNSILVGNHNFAGVEDDCRVINVATPFSSLGYNIFGTYGACYPTASDLVDATPGLLPLADNGGFSETAALSADSPAIGGATCEDHAGVAVTVDQRGYLRPSSGCDVGAFQTDNKKKMFVPLLEW